VRNSNYLIVVMKTCSKFLSKGNTIVTWWLLVQMKHKETYEYAYTDEYLLFLSLQNQGHVFVEAWSWHKEFGSTMALEEVCDRKKFTTETEKASCTAWLFTEWIQW
jgi:hypothetical protein